MKNSGKDSQKAFEEFIRLLGKSAFLRRVTDMAEIRALNPKVKALKFPAQPADFIATINGWMHYAEVKSSQSPTSFSFGKLEKEQWRCATLQTAAGGDYVFYIHSMALGRWFRVPACLILQRRDAGHNSIKWSELEDFAWNPGSLMR
jgi:hypothetical protein